MEQVIGTMDKNITLAGGAVAAQVFGRGQGPVIVLFHSLLADRTSFLRVTEGLAERMTVILPHLPGFGDSPAVEGGLPAVADRMAEAVREAGQRFGGGVAPIVLGNGYGGFVALRMAIAHPGLLSRLILADAGAAFSDPGREAFRAMSRAAEAKGLEAVADTAMRRLFAPDFHAENPTLVAERRSQFLTMDPAVFRRACGDLAALDLRPDLTGVTIPVLVLYGEQDEATPPPMSIELAAALPNAVLRVLPGCAHVPQLQAPERFLPVVSEFLSAAA
jgi:3-oxoadipate enol-lactonase